jgi:hypothetical protein
MAGVGATIPRLQTPVTVKKKALASKLVKANRTSRIRGVADGK